MEETPIDKQFGLGMKELVDAGLDFDEIAQETILEVVGEGPFAALLPKIDEPIQSPSTFVGKLATILPVTIIRNLLLLIVRRAIKSISSPGQSSNYPEFQTLVKKLLASPTQEPSRAGVRPLHDHREEDELDRLVGHRTD
ncbi:MAG TPA: hypothetical protein VIW22_01560 [Nitrososphaerales archaeon]